MRDVGDDFHFGGGIANLQMGVNARRLIGAQLDFVLNIALEARSLDAEIVGARVQVGKGIAAVAVCLDSRAKPAVPWK